jgi:predicted TIM-barrel fold metal-dependent hydrolase
MHKAISRRSFLLGAAALSPALEPVVETHIHLFDPQRFSYHPSATYKPPAAPLEPYLDFVAAAGIAHAVIVHPEPYQDDHRYLEYCFAHERPRGLFKGTLLLDPLSPATPARMRQLVKAHPGRIAALRIHAMNAPGEAPLAAGPIKNRDLRDPRMKQTWAAAADLGLAIQMHFLPHHAPEIGALAREFPRLPVILDHMGRFGQGRAEDLDAVLRLGELPRVYFKFSGLEYSSKTPFPHRDLEPALRRAAASFGAGRLLWGVLGNTLEQYRRAREAFDALLHFLPAAERARIRGANALELFAWR